MLRARTDDTDLVALLAFYSREIATEYLTFSEELQGEGWDVVEVDLRISPRSVPPSVARSPTVGRGSLQRREMSNVPDNLRRQVVEGEGAPDAVRNELLLALVDAVEKLTTEQNEATRALWRIASALEKRAGE
jgi:hypothetical protein